MFIQKRKERGVRQSGGGWDTGGGYCLHHNAPHLAFSRLRFLRRISSRFFLSNSLSFYAKLYMFIEFLNSHRCLHTVLRVIHAMPLCHMHYLIFSHSLKFACNMNFVISCFLFHWFLKEKKLRKFITINVKKKRKHGKKVSELLEIFII